MSKTIDELKTELTELRGKLPPAPEGHLTLTQIAEKLNCTEAEAREHFGPAAKGKDRYGRTIVPVAEYENRVRLLARGVSPGGAAGFMGDK